MRARQPIAAVLFVVLVALSINADAEPYDGESAAAEIYDPLAIPAVKLATPLDLKVHDAKRNRDIPIRVYLPEARTDEPVVKLGPAPVVLFSHGLGGSRANNPYLGRHWSARGFAVVYLQHAGSDEAVWKNARPLARFGALRDAASGENLMLRVQDVGVVLDQLTQWSHQRDDSHAKGTASPTLESAETARQLIGRLDLNRVGMSGHSFGAATTQAVSGQEIAGGLMTWTDPRIKAAIAFSPSAPRVGDVKRAFGSVAIPWLLMTGTNDEARIGGQTPKSRRDVFPALPSGNKYELVLDGAEHSAFGDRALPGDSSTRNPNHHRAILAISTAFWDAYLADDVRARDWLDGDGPRSVLESADVWQTK